MLITVPVNQIRPLLERSSERQLPKVSAKIIKLAKQEGIVTPVTVRPNPPGYELLAGIQTWHLAQLAKIAEIPAYVLEGISDERARELAEVDQGVEQSPFADAKMIRRLVDGGMSMTHAAATIGYTRQKAYQLLDLLDLTDEVQKLVSDGSLKISIARLLTKLDGRTQLGIARTIIKNALSFRQANELVKARTGRAPLHKTAAVAESADPDVQELCDQLSRLIGSPVKIADYNGAGNVSIYFANLEILAGQIERLATGGRVYSLAFGDEGTSGQLLLPYTDYRDLDALIDKFGLQMD